MKIKHVSNDVQSMAHDGGKILKSLQNNYLPLIDIVVREAIQNSLDASLSGIENTKIDFIVDNFDSERLAPVFEEIDQILIERYPGKQNFIAIRDRNTSGLTGDYKTDDFKVLNESNFHKLVFSIGKNQTRDDAGGSWGYGKTSYFRLGAGIVIYYTRIKTDHGFEERLIASIIEDPARKERLLTNNERGIAWWGEYGQDKERILPITDKNEIAKILSVFGLENYEGTETGTTIIIPYLNNIDQEEVIDEEALKYPWESSYEDAIFMAVQRWYFPRILNKSYYTLIGNSVLECKVNNKLIHPDLTLEPIFRIYQDLYSSALSGEAIKPDIHVERIKLGRNALKDTNEEAGYVAFREVSFEELKMTPPENKRHGLAYLGIKDRALLEHNMPKVMAYCRKPGMIIEYSVNGPWANGNMAMKENHILLGIFVPNSSAMLASNFEKAGYSTLETYLRDIEASDHAHWEDHVNITIIKRIRERTNFIINNKYQEESDSLNTSVTSSLSRKFGSLLMPPRNFGKTSARRKPDSKQSGDTGKSRMRGSDVTVVRSRPENEELVNVDFKAFIKSRSSNIILLQVLTQDQKMDYRAWEKTIENAVQFPFWIDDVIIRHINDEAIHKALKDYNGDTIEIRLNDENDTELIINSFLNKDCVIEGTLCLKIRSNQYIPNIAIRTQ